MLITRGVAGSGLWGAWLGLVDARHIPASWQNAVQVLWWARQLGHALVEPEGSIRCKVAACTGTKHRTLDGLLVTGTLGREPTIHG